MFYHLYDPETNTHYANSFASDASPKSAVPVEGWQWVQGYPAEGAALYSPPDKVHDAKNQLMDLFYSLPASVQAQYWNVKTTMDDAMNSGREDVVLLIVQGITIPQELSQYQPVKDQMVQILTQLVGGS